MGILAVPTGPPPPTSGPPAQASVLSPCRETLLMSSGSRASSPRLEFMDAQGLQRHQHHSSRYAKRDRICSQSHVTRTASHMQVFCMHQYGDNG
eukprot:3416225-Pleurochrysis_carterae.AAC.1